MITEKTKEKNVELMGPSNNKKPVILIVDDVPKNVQVLGNYLRKVDCDLAVAMNGHQALKTISRLKPDLILLDVMMPDMDGHEVCRRLKSNDQTKDIPIIFLSAKSEIDDIIKGFELGAVDYIAKPFIGSELLARVRTHLTLKELKGKLEEEVRYKNNFFSIISHDLRGSFGIILSFVKLLQNNRNSLSEHEINDLLGDIESTAKSTLNLLENLLGWARSQTNGIRFNPVMLNLETLVNEILKSSADIAENKNIELDASVHSQPVYADRNMLLLIFRNLISNAVKFTPEGGKVRVNTAFLNGSVKVSVSDTGVGMDPEMVGKLFKDDYKISTPGTKNEPGNGLGLILCKEFIRQHKGEIGIESVPKNGTTVWFTLPLFKKE